jgi:hypothetical protein
MILIIFLDISASSNNFWEHCSRVPPLFAQPDPHEVQHEELYKGDGRAMIVYYVQKEM